MKISTFILASFTLIAFAANSVLCRQALMTDSIGPVEFTVIRLAAGAIALLPVILFRREEKHSREIGPSNETGPLEIRPVNIWPPLALMGYAIFFSLAYVQLDAAVGALILFPTVQITMIGGAILQGNRVAPIQWAGVIISFVGLVYLLSPGITAPPLLGTVLMIISGASWGVYSLLGKRQKRPILSTARNFLFTLPGIAVLSLVAIGTAIRNGSVGLSPHGIILAIISGAVTSGIGYVLWYLTIRRISTTAASVSQLAVPILVAAGGVIFLHESLSLRLILASILIVGGIVLTTLNRKAPQASTGPARVESR